jgi:Txe/YoeB family toxin of Txe-Axe toxin-antitoxin module
VSMLERVEQFQGALSAAAATGIVTILISVVRRSFTIQKKIELLEQDIKHRDERRIADRELIELVHKDLIEMRNYVMTRDH